jgi:predicted PurR-regulated permease PerM
MCLPGAGGDLDNQRQGENVMSIDVKYRTPSNDDGGVLTPGTVRRLMVAATTLAVCIVGAALYVAHAAFVPIALALLCALILSGPVEALQRLRIPRGLSAAIILLLALATTFGVVSYVWAPAQEWFDRAPLDMETIKLKLSPIAHFVTHVEDLRSSARTIERGSLSPTSPAAGLGMESAPMLIFDATRAAAISTLAFVLVTLFLLIGGPPMLANMAAAMTSELRSGHIIDLIEAVRLEVGRYYAATALINVTFGCAIAGAMALCGMPNPILWGMLAAILNFIPYAGSAATLMVLTLVALVTFDGLGRVVAVMGCYLVIATVVGQILQPMVVGRRLQVNPLLIFLALWFFGVFWGLAGVILSTPILVACKVIAEHADNGAALLKFMGPPPLSSTLLARIRTVAMRS